MKGIILAAGEGTRLYPITKVIPKPLVSVYNKPMIYYSIESLVESGITDIIIVTSEKRFDMVQDAVGDGSNFGAKITYTIQGNAKGSAIAVQAALPFIYDEDVVLMYADNILLSKNMKYILQEGIKNLAYNCSTIFTFPVLNPQGFGIAELDGNIVKTFEEKPKAPRSNLAAAGLYVLTKDFSEKIMNVHMSGRGEYEAAEMIGMYQSEGRLRAVRLDDYDCAWFDAGTPDALLEASIAAKKMHDQIKLLGENYEKKI